MRLEFIIGGIVVALLIIAALTFWPESDESPVPAGAPAAEEVEAPEPVPQAEIPAPADEEMQSLPDTPAASVEAPVPAEILPPLAMSDDWVREALATWPVPEGVLQREALLARLVVVLVNASEGAVPHREVAFLAPDQAFRAISRGGTASRASMYPSKRRYDTGSRTYRSSSNSLARKA